ncbi:UNKNOWN [Stylonychia lemnae]|uniref:Uncharacterized protein n=1 Tax=Stylonychia lemnae TaxID=5949 RepID=A0A078AL26_STYLE|nr:UNKNOWN [Stylonychia lemnae]|eukprot:CDW83070.1 UNKNOWN [Stylonychia lemnae]
MNKSCDFTSSKPILTTNNSTNHSKKRKTVQNALQKFQAEIIENQKHIKIQSSIKQQVIDQIAQTKKDIRNIQKYTQAIKNNQPRDQKLTMKKELKQESDQINKLQAECQQYQRNCNDSSLKILKELRKLTDLQRNVNQMQNELRIQQKEKEKIQIDAINQRKIIKNQEIRCNQLREITEFNYDKFLNETQKLNN